MTEIKRIGPEGQEQEQEQEAAPDDFKPYSEVDKKFLTGPDVLDDAYVSTAIVGGAKAFKAGLSIHDGEHTVCFEWDIFAVTRATAKTSLERPVAVLTALREAISKLDCRIRSLAVECLDR